MVSCTYILLRKPIILSLHGSFFAAWTVRLGSVSISLMLLVGLNRCFCTLCSVDVLHSFLGSPHNFRQARTNKETVLLFLAKILFNFLPTKTIILLPAALIPTIPTLKTAPTTARWPPPLLKKRRNSPTKRRSWRPQWRR